MSLFRKKDLAAMLAQSEDGSKGLKRTLGAGNPLAELLLLKTKLQDAE